MTWNLVLAAAASKTIKTSAPEGPEASPRGAPGDAAGLSLPTSPLLLRRLMLRVAMGTLLDHGFSAALTPTDPPNLGAFARGAPLRNPGLAAPAERAASAPDRGESGSRGRTAGSGSCCARLDRMASAARDRKAGDRDRLAPTGLPTLVDLEE